LRRTGNFFSGLFNRLVVLFVEDLQSYPS
jgi:hypothetical protein